MCFERVFIIGFGQMGKSIANTLRVNHFSGKIFASSRHKIEQCDYIDGTFDIEDINNNYKNSIIFICVSLNAMLKMIEKMIEKTKNTHCIISDVCSVKNNIFISNKVAKNGNFISIHPMDGGNSTDQKEFFKKYILNYIITDNLTKFNVNMLTRYNNFLHNFLNCKNVTIASEMHDKIVAIISHIPNLILMSLHRILEEKKEMWQAIFQKNKNNIGMLLGDFIETLRYTNVNSMSINYRLFLQKHNVNIEQNLQNPSLRKVLNMKLTYEDLDQFILALKNNFNILVNGL